MRQITAISDPHPGLGNYGVNDPKHGMTKQPFRIPSRAPRLNQVSSNFCEKYRARQKLNKSFQLTSKFESDLFVWPLEVGTTITSKG